jgi:hypothetical protein
LTFLSLTPLPVPGQSALAFMSRLVPRIDASDPAFISLDRRQLNKSAGGRRGKELVFTPNTSRALRVPGDARHSIRIDLIESDAETHGRNRHDIDLVTNCGDKICNDIGPPQGGTNVESTHHPVSNKPTELVEPLEGGNITPSECSVQTLRRLVVPEHNVVVNHLPSVIRNRAGHTFRQRIAIVQNCRKERKVVDSVAFCARLWIAYFLINRPVETAISAGQSF